jgi:hypothetical protein
VRLVDRSGVATVAAETARIRTFSDLMPLPIAWIDPDSYPCLDEVRLAPSHC